MNDIKKEIRDVLDRWDKLDGVPNTPGAIIRFAQDRFDEIQDIINRTGSD